DTWPMRGLLAPSLVMVACVLASGSSGCNEDGALPNVARDQGVAGNQAPDLVFPPDLHVSPDLTYVPRPPVCGDTSGLQHNAPWPMQGYCPSHQCRSPFNGPPSSHVRWRIELRSSPTAAVIAADGTVFVVSGSGGDLTALDPATGVVKWMKYIGDTSVAPAI